MGITDKNMSPAEIKLSKLGFYLLEEGTITIDDNLSYPIITYARFLDDDKTATDMTIRFDPSQYSIDLWQRYSSTVFIDPPLLDAIQDRAKELKYRSSGMHSTEISK